MTSEEREMLLEMAAVRELLDEELEACVELVKAQSLYPDTHTGTRQRWLKQEIIAKIRARKEACT